MDVISAIRVRRSIRRYLRKPVDRNILVEIVNTARLAPSTVNLQPLCFIIVNDDDLTAALFPSIRMGALLPEQKRTTDNERPTAFIVVLVDTKIMKSGYEYDVGCACQNMLLAAVSFNLGACFIRNIDRDTIRTLLSVPPDYEIDTVIAVGHPAHEPVAEDRDTPDMRYYLDGEGVHRVPKRPLSTVIHFNRY